MTNFFEGFNKVATKGPLMGVLRSAQKKGMGAPVKNYLNRATTTGDLVKKLKHVGRKLFKRR